MAMTGMLQTLINELQSDDTLKNHPVLQLYITGANNALNSKDPDSVYETFLNNLDSVSEFLGEKKESVKAFVKKKKEDLDKTAKKKGKKGVGDAKLKEKVQKIRESNAGSDPIIKTACNKLDEALDVMPEFKSIVPFLRIFEGHRYDSVVKQVVDEAQAFLEANRAKIMIADTVFELSKVKNPIYNSLVAVLEESLETGNVSADSLKMKLRDFTSLPVSARLINALSMNEAQEQGTFDIGIGTSVTAVSPVISPYQKVGKKEYAFVDNKLYVINEEDETEDEDPENPTEQVDVISQDDYDGMSDEFKKACESFYYLGFKEIDGKFVSTATRKIKVQLAVNEKQKIDVYLNGSKVEDPSKVNITEIGLMESIDARRLLTNFFESLGFLANIQNIKRLKNAQHGKEAFAISLNEAIFVLEKGNPAEKFLKVTPIGFHKYVLEKFQYDVRDLYSIRLSEAEEVAHAIDDEKKDVDDDIKKLEEASKKVSDALAGKELDSQAVEHLTNLSESIEKSIVSLKNRYIELDLAKKK